MGGSIGAIVSVVVGAVLAGVAAFAVPSAIGGNPQPVTEPLVSYGSTN